MIVNCTQLKCKKYVFFLFFNLKFQYVLYFGRAKFYIPFYRIIGAIRPMVCSEVLGHPISVCHSKLFKYIQNDCSVKTQHYYIQYCDVCCMFRLQLTTIRQTFQYMDITCSGFAVEIQTFKLIKPSIIKYLD